MSLSINTVILETSLGDITLTLNAEKAPLTVANFLTYVKNGHFDETIFHRVIDGFMIQGGGFDKDFQQKSTLSPIQNEADNGLKNTLGSVAMARTGDPHSASAQFFINVANNAFLNHSAKTQAGWGYAVFGAVSAGMDVVDKIRQVKTGSQGPHQDVPKETVCIKKARIQEDAAQKTD